MSLISRKAHLKCSIHYHLSVKRRFYWRVYKL